MQTNNEKYNNQIVSLQVYVHYTLLYVCNAYTYGLAIHK